MSYEALREDLENVLAQAAIDLPDEPTDGDLLDAVERLAGLEWDGQGGYWRRDAPRRARAWKAAHDAHCELVAVERKTGMNIFTDWYPAEKRYRDKLDAARKLESASARESAREEPGPGEVPPEALDIPCERGDSNPHKHSPTGT